MGTAKRERQKAGHRARLTAEKAAQVRYERRRRLALSAALAAFVVVVGVVVVLLTRDDGGDTASAADSTTTVAPVSGAESAAGKPCVALADPLPEGAPDVPVPVGDPPTELVTQDLVVGEGEPVPAGATVTVDYVGVSCSTGAIFDDSYSRGAPATFPLDQVIPGWTQGIVGMQPGGQRLLVIPPDLGYGPTGNGTIAPDETLVFVVDLKSWEPTAPVDSVPSTDTTIPGGSDSSSTVDGSSAGPSTTVAG